MKKHKHGFTLAEVLITLVIIGIIAAMTIPTLMNKTNEQENVVALKKMYSTLSQGYQRIVADYGSINSSSFGSSYEEATKNFGDTFAKYLSVQKNCGMTTDEDCWSIENGGVYKQLDNVDRTNWNKTSTHYKIRLNDGSSIAIFFFGYSRQVGKNRYAIASVDVDINGDKGPNMAGKDWFSFWVTENGVLPFGMPDDDDTYGSFSLCSTIGEACAAWVVTKGNMDYLRKDVSW